MFFRKTSLLICAALMAHVVCAPAESMQPPSDFTVKAQPGMLRVDLSWQPQGERMRYEVQRASSIQGDWVTLPNPTPEFRRYSDYVGEAGRHFFYRVRGMKHDQEIHEESEWSQPVEATTQPYDRERLLADVQQAAVRFYFDKAHPVCGLSPEGAPGWGTTTAIGSSGMGMANIVVGVDRGFVSRKEGLDLALRMWRFLDTKAEKPKCAFGHWMDGQTGAVRKFGNTTAVDLVETSFLIQGGILLREYFRGDTPEEKELRDIVNRISAEVQWDQFMVEEKSGPIMMWHWHPEEGFGTMPIRGFHEAMMPYILGIASETHPINPKSFYTGWMDPQIGLGQRREDFGITHSLGSGIGWPLFFAHYSHIGFDPKQISYAGKTYFEHFVDACRIQQLYARSRAADFKGYDTLWGHAASLCPGGYRANQPGPSDDGTIATTAALSSMPYLPEAVWPCMESMYLNYGKQLWGPYGFYNAINPTRDWVGQRYIGIELGPIAPMIENYRSGLFWRLFMQSPEAQRALKRIAAAKPNP